MKALRVKLAILELQPEIQRALIVGRPDSVMALAHLADRVGEAPVVRYLVLCELFGVVSDWESLLDEDLVLRTKQMVIDARKRTHIQLLKEVNGDEEKAKAMLGWFERKLAEFDVRDTT